MGTTINGNIASIDVDVAQGWSVTIDLNHRPILQHGDVVTLTKVEPDHKSIDELLADPKIKAKINAIQRDFAAAGMCHSQEKFNELFLSAFRGAETLLCRPDELETARAILEATEAMREAVEPEKTDKPVTEKTIKVDRNGSALEAIVVNKGDNVLLIREHTRQEVDATRLAAIADTLSSLPIPINLSWMKYAVDDLRSIATRIRDIP